MQKKDVVRCGNCQKLLAKGVYAILEIKCARCGTLNHLRAESPEPERLRASCDGVHNDASQASRRLGGR